MQERYQNHEIIKCEETYAAMYDYLEYSDKGRQKGGGANCTHKSTPTSCRRRLQELMFLLKGLHESVMYTSAVSKTTYGKQLYYTPSVPNYKSF